MKITHYRLFAVIAMFVIAVMPPVSATAQGIKTPYDGFTQSGLGGSYAAGGPLSDIDHIDLLSGSLRLRIPLLQIGGRGTVGRTEYFSPDRPWAMAKDRELVSCFPSNVCTFRDKYFVGRDFGNRPGVLFARHAGVDNHPCNGFDQGFDSMLTRLTFVNSDGTEVELIDAIYNGEPKGINGGCLTGHSRGTEWYSTDGSAMTFISDTPISDLPVHSTRVVSGNLMMRDGTKYRIDGGAITSIRDRNGNMITFSYPGDGSTVITDPLKRVIESRNGQFTYKGYQGASRAISLVHESEVRLRPGFSSLRTNASAFPEIPDLQFPAQSIDPVTWIQRIVLPDNREYKIWHNDYGDIARIDLPTGGRIEYDYAAGAGTYQSGVLAGLGGIYRRVVMRRVYLNTTDTIPVEETRYSDLVGGSVIVRRVVPGTEINLSYTKHYIFGDPTSSMSHDTEPTRYRNWNDGLEWKTEFYDASGTILIKRVERNYQPRVTHVWRPHPSVAIPRSFDPQLRSVTITLADVTPNLVSRTTYDYDQYNNVTDVHEYGFGSGSPGPLIRRTHTSYLTTNGNQGDVNYAAELNIHIRDLPVQKTVYDESGNQRSQTDFIYDNYAGLPLVGRPGIVQHDSGFDTGYGARGNLTGTILSNPGGSPLEIHLHSQYDVAGNVVKAVDGLGFDTDIDYIDCFGADDDEARSNAGAPELAGGLTYALPTKVTNELEHTEYTQYDYYLGMLVNSEDANGVISSFAYNDALGRMTRSVLARWKVGGGVPAERRQKTVTYDNVNRVVTTTSDQIIFNDNVLAGKSYSDGLGRMRRVAAREGATWTISDTQFDALGRVSQVSNPYRGADPDSASPPPGLWTKTVYDAIGRSVDVETPDGAHVITEHRGARVTVTDPAGKKRSTVSDALGRLIKVIEDPGRSNFETFYSYDALDNLRQVTKGSQTRIFNFDSLSRLVSTTNPESGPMTYAYDANGNLKEKIDARGVRTTMTYDRLNRVSSKVYEGTTPAGTAAANETLPVSYFYDDPSGLPSGAPIWTGMPSKGRLIGVTYGSGSEGTYYKYDVAGRIVTNHQRQGIKNYATTYNYNLAGGVTFEQRGGYFRNTWAYDNAGRISAMEASFTPFLSSVYLVKDISYTPFGGLQSEKYGNGLIHSIGYNNRQQPTEMRLGRPDNLESVFTIYNIYGTAQNVNAQDAEITPTQNNGNLARTKYSVSGTIQYTQTFQYDPLNRLSYAVEHSNGEYNDGMRAWYQTFEYDPFGNRGLNVDYTSDNADEMNNALKLADFSMVNNRITRDGFLYDAAGNLIAEPGGKSFTFDAENRIVRATGAGGVTSQYVYDGIGNRVKKIVGANATRFEYGAGGGLIAERNEATGVVTKAYCYKGRELIATTNNGVAYEYATADHLGSVRAWVATDGSIRRNDYMPFGEDLVAGVGIRSSSNGYNGDSARQKFTGQESDAETGLYYFKARYFSSAQGRFTGVDPMNFGIAVINPQNWNRYIYALNNPLSIMDGNGKFPTAIHDLITELAFPGLKHNELKRINLGNFHTDFESGLFPGTLFEVFANRHSMAIPGQTVPEAMAGAKSYIVDMDRMALNSPAIEKLYHFGKGDHTLQDGVSPEHGFKTYVGMPGMLKGTPLDFIMAVQWYQWGKAMLAHRAGENGITGEQLNEAIRLSREHFKRVFPKDYKRAISGQPLFTFSPTAWIEVHKGFVEVTDLKIGNDFVQVNCRKDGKCEP